MHDVCAVFPSITSLSIVDNPVLDASPQLLRSFVIALLPNLEHFNGKMITFVERANAVEKYKPFFQSYGKQIKTDAKPIKRVGPGGMSQSTPNASEVSTALLRNVTKMRHMRNVFDQVPMLYMWFMCYIR